MLLEINLFRFLQIVNIIAYNKKKSSTSLKCSHKKHRNFNRYFYIRIIKYVYMYIYSNPVGTTVTVNNQYARCLLINWIYSVLHSWKFYGYDIVQIFMINN